MAIHSHPITPARTYVLVWVALVILTGVTYYVATFDLGFLNTAAALGIAVIKATMVVLMFMGLRFNTPLTKIVAISGVFWLFILFTLGMSDYLSRGWLGVPGR